MASKLTKVVANFETTLSTKLASGATSGTLTSATDKNGAALPAGKYCMVVDRGTGDEEHLLFDLSGTSMSNIKSVSRQGTETSGVQNANGHRVGAKCYLTDFVNLKRIVDILNGDDTLDGTKPIKYDAHPTFNANEQLVDKKYADDLALAGAPDASVTVKGVVEEATEAEIEAGTAAGGTGARLAVNPATLKSSDYGTAIYNRNNDYAADAGSNDTYAITLTPAPASYTTGMTIRFKPNTRNTGACTINVNSLGAKSIKKEGNLDPADGDLEAGQIYEMVYDGTNFQLLNPKGAVPTGTIMMWGTATAPAGYLLCDGTAVSRTTYATLFAVLGTAYGVGDGSTTFNLPNLKGRVPVGLDSGQTEFDALAESGGAKTHTLTTNEMPAHAHKIWTKVGNPSASTSGNTDPNDASNLTNLGDRNTESSGGGAAHNNLQPYLVLNFIVKI